MKIFFIYVWIFPVLFMLHDFEEIIMINAWQQRNKKYIKNLEHKHIPFDCNASTAAFSIAVAEEFLILSVITLVSSLINNYILWYGFFIAFTLHLFFHIFQFLIFKKYVPSIITSIIFIPISCFIIYKTTILLNYNLITSLVSILISILIMVTNILFLHKSFKKFDFWLECYTSKSDGAL